MTTTQWPNRYWGDKTPPQTKAEFFNAVTAPAPAGGDLTGTLATIRMYGPIDSWGGYWGISAKDVGQVLDALPESVTEVILRINSPGGECSEAAAILNMLRAHRARILAVVDGLAASAASVIAVGCDETVMSPGTQMMIHSPWSIAWGNAAEMRKEAAVLDNFEAAIIEIYEAKAGAKDWATLLAEETWLTGPQAIELGLADRTAVIPDAGETETPGEDVIIVVPLEDEMEPEDSVRRTSSATRITVKAAAAAPKLPRSSEPGEPNRKEEAVAYSDLTAGLRERLGMTDVDTTDDELLAAVDEALAERADDTTPTELPEGVVTVEESTLAALRADAAAGRTAREEQLRQSREVAVDAAINDGRISPSRRDHWITALAADPGAADTLAKLESGLIPLEPKGHTGGVDEAGDDDVRYTKLFPTQNQEA